MKEDALMKMPLSGKQVSVKNVGNIRVVLPHSSCPSHRRVIAPGCSNMNIISSLQVTDHGKNAQEHQRRASQSKSAKEYKEYLEDMELKIRYMKNDIEFKQSQIQSKKAMSSQAPHLNSNVNVQSAQSNLTFHTTHSYKATEVTQRPGHESVPQIYHKNVAPRYTYVQRTHSEHNKLITKSTLKHAKNFKVLKEPVSSQSSGSRIPPSLLDTSSHVFTPTQCVNNVNPTVAENPQCTRAPTTSLLQRNEGFAAITSPKPIYVSPTKNQAIWSYSKDHSIIYPSMDKRQTQLSHKFNSSTKEKVSTATIATSQTLQPSTSSSKPVVADSKYKFINPNVSSSPTVSLGPYTSSVNRSNSNILHSYEKSTHGKSSTKKHPKSKVPGKVVSKYKMTRLSASVVSKVSHPFICSQLSSERPLLSQSKIDQTESRDPRKADAVPQKANVTPTLQSRPPKLEIVMAAKLVSKYKLKRLSPTSASKVAPQLLHNHSSPFTPTSLSTPSCPKRSTFVKNNLKYHQRSSFSSSPHTFKSKALTFNTSRKTASPHKRVSQTQLKGFACRPGQNVGHQRFVLDRRVGLHADMKAGVAPDAAVNNRHKVDRRPQKQSTSKELSQAIGRKRNKHSWISPISISPSSSVLRKQQSSNSRFKWRRPSSVEPNSFQSRCSLFKWPQQSTWGSVSINQRYATWMRKSSLVMIRGVVYKSHWQTSAHKTNHQTQIRDTFNLAESSRTNLKLINLRGAHFHTDSRGKKLFRAGLATASQDSKSTVFNARKRHRSQAKTVNETTILAASRVIHRSIAVAAAKFKKDNTKWKKEKQLCIFYSRFGKCHRGEKCKYVHDPEKVAVCTRFLRGKCDSTRCQFSHSASEHKMPVCLHYLQGLCSRDNCPYLHVRVNPDAPVCKDFHNGYCPLGKKCKKLHSLVCPSFAVTGECSRGESCSLLHRRIRREHAGKELGVNRKQRPHKRRRLSSKEKNSTKTRIMELPLSVATEIKPEKGISLDKGHSNAISDVKNAVETFPLPHTQNPHTSMQQNDELRNSCANEKDLQDSIEISASLLVASPKKGPASLASQPSFISLLSDSPVTCKPVLHSSEPGLMKDSQKGLSIKPLFISQRLTVSEQAQCQNSFSKDSSANIPNSNLEETNRHKPVPTPAFLSGRIAKGDVK